MKQKSCFFISLIITFCQVNLIFAQGKACVLRGKVSDPSGELLVGVVIKATGDKLKPVVTDLDGNYSIPMPAEEELELTFALLGYTPQTIQVKCTGSDVVIQDLVLNLLTSDLKEVVVEAKQTRSGDKYYERIKINSAVSIDYVSSEVMKQTGDANMAAVVARVPGVSTNGAFFTVRGIGDKYIKTTVNGLSIPTLDPLTNNIKLDIFPSSMIDNVVVTKTHAAELPGDFSGALLALETKDYPEKFTLNFESSIGYNPQATFQDYVGSERSATDWLGFSSNLRHYDHASFTPINLEPSPYQEFSGLGLSDFFNSLGINDKTPWKVAYTKLALVELGLLEKGKFDDDAAFQAALNTYNRDNRYRNLAIKNLNASALESNKSFSTNWTGQERKGGINHSYSLSVGNQKLLFDRPLGFVAAVRYSSSFQYDPVSLINRATVDANGERGLDFSSEQGIARETNGWSGVFNVGYKLSPNHAISYFFMPVFSGVNNIRDGLDTANGVYNLYNTDQFYEQRRQLIQQIRSEHFIKPWNLKVDASYAYTVGNSEAPDFRSLNYGNTPGTDEYQIGGLLAIRRFHRFLNERVEDVRINFSMPLFETPSLKRKIKWGLFATETARANRQYEYFLNFGPNALSSYRGTDIAAFFADSNYYWNERVRDGDTSVSINHFYRRVDLDSYRTIGSSKIYGFYTGTDYAMNRRLRLNAGLRMEYSEVFSDVFKFDSLGFVRNDPRRLQLEDLFIVNPGKVIDRMFLPSAGIIWHVAGTVDAPLNIRFNYGKSIARPTIREITETLIFDYEFRNFVFGNSELRSVTIHNFEIKGEWYSESGDHISLSGFYKSFLNHIEQIRTVQGFSWQNAEEGLVQGVELEGKKTLFKNLDLRMNIAWIYSQTRFVNKFMLVEAGVKSFAPIDTVRRSMFGQAPYVFNCQLVYKWQKQAAVFSASYNVQGPRLVIVSGDLTPNIYELPRHLVDLKVSKELKNGFYTSVSVRDLLNAPIIRAYKFPEGYTLEFDRYVFGTTYFLALGYRL